MGDVLFYIFTSIGLGLLGLLFVCLSYRVSQLRLRHGVTLGDGDNAELRQAIRAQGNFVEYVPMCVLLILAGQTISVNGWIGLIAMIALVVGRVFHAFGLYSSEGRSTGRLVGTLLTWLVLAGMSLVLIVSALLRLV